MINVIKKKDLDNTYSIFIEADEGSFVFTFCGNLDLYFSYFGKDRLKKDDHSFILDKDDYFLYKCFDELYSTIVDENAFKSSKNCPNKTLESGLYSSLVKNGVIEWYSDDSTYDNAAVLFIEKFDDFYRITIKEGLIADINMKTAAIRFRNNGSKYSPYNYVFMNLYNNLCKHDFDNEQVSIYKYVSGEKVRKR